MRGAIKSPLQRGRLSLLPREASFWGLRWERDEGVHGERAASPRVRGRPCGGETRTGAPNDSQPPRRGGSGPAHSSTEAQKTAKLGGFSAVPPGAPRAPTWNAGPELPQERTSAPEIARSLLPALFIFQRAEPRAARRSVCPSVGEQVRAPPHSMAAPRGLHPLVPAPPPGARRTPRGAQGQWGARDASLRGWAGPERRWAGRGRDGGARRAAAGAARGVAFTRTPRGA